MPTINTINYNKGDVTMFKKKTAKVTKFATKSKPLAAFKPKAIITIDKPMQSVSKPPSYSMTVTPDANAVDPLAKDTFGTIVCFSEEFAIGHTHSFKSLAAVGSAIRMDRLIALPIYLTNVKEEYNLTTKVSKTIAEESQIGYIYVDSKDAAKEFNVQRVGTGIRRDVEAKLIKEVEQYNAYLHSNTFAYTITDDTGKVIHSETGFASEAAAQSAGKIILDNLVTSVTMPVVKKKTKFA